jgi:hypothetical protein
VGWQLQKIIDLCRHHKLPAIVSMQVTCIIGFHESYST